MKRLVLLQLASQKVGELHNAENYAISFKFRVFAAPAIHLLHISSLQVEAAPVTVSQLRHLALEGLVCLARVWVAFVQVVCQVKESQSAHFRSLRCK